MSLETVWKTSGLAALMRVMGAALADLDTVWKESGKRLVPVPIRARRGERHMNGPRDHG